jgi:hypothetical protein
MLNMAAHPKLETIWDPTFVVNVKNGVKLGKNCTSYNNFRVGWKD